MNERQAIDELYRILSAIYLAAPVNGERIAAWRACTSDLPAEHIVAVVDDAAKIWPDRMPTMAQIRSEVLLRKRDATRSQTRQEDSGPTLNPWDVAWNDAHPDSPWVQLSLLWSEYPRGGSRPPEIDEREGILLKALGINNVSPRGLVGALTRSV